MSLPINRRLPFSVSAFPRDISAYRPLDHFVQRYKDHQRCITKRILKETIEEGEIRDNGDGCACFVREFGGVRYYIIAGHDENEGDLVLVSGWPLLLDWVEAREAGWPPEVLAGIKQHNDDHYNDGTTWEEYSEWTGYTIRCDNNTKKRTFQGGMRT